VNRSPIHGGRSRVLGLAAGLEAWSLLTTIRAGRSAKGPQLWQLLRSRRRLRSSFVFLEDVGALLGIGIALVGLTLATVTGESAWDGPRRSPSDSCS